MDDDSAHIPVTFERYDHIEGPFYHGTKASVTPGDLLVPGYGSNFEDGRVSNNIYFTGTLDAAVWERSWPRARERDGYTSSNPPGPSKTLPT